MSKSFLDMIARNPGLSFPERCLDYGSGIVPVGFLPRLLGAVLPGEVSIDFSPDLLPLSVGLVGFCLHTTLVWTIQSFQSSRVVRVQAAA